MHICHKGTVQHSVRGEPSKPSLKVLKVTCSAAPACFNRQAPIAGEQHQHMHTHMDTHTGIHHAPTPSPSAHGSQPACCFALAAVPHLPRCGDAGGHDAVPGVWQQRVLIPQEPLVARLSGLQHLQVLHTCTVAAAGSMAGSMSCGVSRSKAVASLHQLTGPLVLVRCWTEHCCEAVCA